VSPDLFHEFWRMQLLDELHRKLDAFEWEPALDPRGSRRAVLEELIDRFEAIEAVQLANRSQAPGYAGGRSQPKLKGVTP
jgi:hypothetical protein